jgi:hypothetical protein
MKLEWNEEQPNVHVAYVHFTSLGVSVHGIARVFLGAGGYLVEVGVGAPVQFGGGLDAIGGGLNESNATDFDGAVARATQMLHHQLKTLQEQLQAVLKGGEEEGFGEVRPDGG